MLMKREQVHRIVIKLIFVVYWLLLFEGILRKWLLPMLQKPLFFIRDPFVLVIYFLAFRYGLWPKHSPMFTTSLILAFLSFLLMLLQIPVNDLSPLVGLYGWRNYFLYLPLAFIIGTHFKAADLRLLVKRTLLTAIPIACLTAIQFKSAPSSVVNKTLADAAPLMVTEEIVRSTGTFTSTVGHNLYISSLLLMLFAVWIRPKQERPFRAPVLFLVTGCAVAVLAFAGSRSALILAMFDGVLALLSCLLLHKDSRNDLRLRGIAIMSVVLVSAVTLYLTVFNSAYEAMKERQSLAVQSEGSTAGRGLRIITDVFDVLPSCDLIGRGIGLGTGGGAQLATGTSTLLLAENEWPRIVMECGVWGLLYVVFRITLVFWLLIGAIKATMRANDVLPFMLWGFVCPTLLIGQITLQGTANGYAWLFLGFSLAANQLNFSQNIKAGYHTLQPFKGT